MKIEDIVEGIEYRLNGLRECIETLEASESRKAILSVIMDYEVRFDELDSLQVWIKENMKEENEKN